LCDACVSSNFQVRGRFICVLGFKQDEWKKAEGGISVEGDERMKGNKADGGKIGYKGAHASDVIPAWAEIYRLAPC